MSNEARETLRAALNPESVAIVGASDNPNKIGGSRGHVTGVAGRLRGARQRPPDNRQGAADDGEEGKTGE